MYRNICLCLLFALFQWALSAPNWMDALPQADDDCLAESGMSRYDFGKQIINPSADFLWNQGMACYLLCIGRKKGEIHSNGTFHTDLFRQDPEFVFSPKMIKSLDECTLQREADACDTFRNNYLCVVRVLMKAWQDRWAGFE